MRVRVRFRLNSETGEVEEFQVDDLGQELGAGHDAEHDRIAHEVGSVLEPRPLIEEVRPYGGAGGQPAYRQAAADDEAERRSAAQDGEIAQ